jgi:hypothetical protein
VNTLTVDDRTILRYLELETIAQKLIQENIISYCLVPIHGTGDYGGNVALPVTQC